MEFSAFLLFAQPFMAKQKKETSNEISFFVVRSTGIEPRSKIRNPFIFKAFRLSVPEKSPK